MATALTHRGPDAAGIWTDASTGLALGHRRLAIVDLTPTGAQPMISRDERYVISFNGEIYNFPGLREQLVRQGVVLRGGSDTEVLLECIARSGIETALEQANGMFAFALWDRSDRSLTLCRDRMGEKPLYLAWAGKCLLFASELSALRSHPDFHAEVDTEAVADLLRYSCIPAPRSIYRGVHKLPPGHLLTVSEAESPGELAWRPYWDLRHVAEQGIRGGGPGPGDRGLAELERLLSASVREQMVADVPVGCFLSGGIDSSLVTALAQETRDGGPPVRTFTLGFEEKAWDEAPYGRAVAKHLRTDHTEHYVSATEALAVVPALPSIYDEPFADSSQIPTVLLARLARESVTVALTGDGGDELFAGYDRYLVHGRLASLVDRVPAFGRRAVGSSLLYVRPEHLDRGVGMLSAAFPRLRSVSRPGDKLHKAARLLQHTGSTALYDALMSAWPEPNQVLLSTATSRSAAGQRPLPGDAIRRLQYLDQSTYLPDDLLVKVDRAAMSVSLETRVPMLAPAVVAHSWSLPTSALVAGGRGKLPLRELLSRRLPAELIERPKQGFGVPLGSWLRGPLRDWAHDLLSASTVEATGVFRPTVVTALLDRHDRGPQDCSAQLWPVLMFQAWSLHLASTG